MKRYSHTFRRPARLTVFPLEPRETPAVSTFQALGAAAGGLPLVEVVRPDGTDLVRFQAYDSAFRGGVRAAVGELDGDPNTLAVVTGAGPGGGPHVKVFRVDLTTNTVDEIAGFFAFDPAFAGGVRVAVGHVAPTAGTGQDIIVGADEGGGPHVKVFSVSGSSVAPVGGPLGSFFAFEPGFTGGVRVASGELDGNTDDGDELVVSAGSSGGPRVQVLRSDGSTLADYFAFRSDFLGGVNVGTESTGGTTDRVRVDGFVEDFSQRNLDLIQAAVAAVTPAAVNAGTVTVDPSNTAAVSTGTTGVVGTGVGNTFGTGSAFSTGTNPVFTSGTVPIFSTGTTTFGTGLGTTGIGTTGFGTTGLGSQTFGTAGLGTLGFGTGGFSTTGFGSTGFGTTGFNTGFGTTDLLGTTGIGTGFNGSAIGTPLTTGTLGTGTFGTGTFGTGTFGVFGNPGTLTAFPTLFNPPFVSTIPTTITGTTVGGTLVGTTNPALPGVVIPTL